MMRTRYSLVQPSRHTRRAADPCRWLDVLLEWFHPSVRQRREAPMAARRRCVDLVPFDFTQAMGRLCEDLTNRHEAFQHIDMSRVAVCFAQARSRVLHGLQAKLTPLRFEGGSLTCRRRNQTWTVQRVYLGEREMLYVLTFYLPRFLNQSFKEKLITVLHELYHISPHFDGDIRRMGGRYHVHSHSQHDYDREMARFTAEYLSLRPPAELFDFLRYDFRELRRRHGGVIGLQVPIPKLIPLDGLKSA